MKGKHKTGLRKLLALQGTCLFCWRIVVAESFVHFEGVWQLKTFNLVCSPLIPAPPPLLGKSIQVSVNRANWLLATLFSMYQLIYFSCTQMLTSIELGVLLETTGPEGLLMVVRAAFWQGMPLCFLALI